jgi:hypothetical protein
MGRCTNNILLMIVFLRIILSKSVTTCLLITLGFYLHWGSGQPLPSIWDGLGEDGMGLVREILSE